MIFGSVCSGIEAASTAWEHLGWRAAWFAEIEPFPSAVLAHHWPEVPNLGDFTKIRDRLDSWESPAPDVLVGGTPCQAFSVAGLRQSMDDARGQLTIEFVRLANAIDATRSLLGIPECIVVWENVPGVLNTPDNAFGCFLAGLAGEDDPLLPPGGRWTNAGRVLGPTRAVAWRILDAQYFGVAQRRRRVFVVASARDGVCPDEVLFEFDGVCRDSPPRREAGKDFARVAGTLAANGGGLTRPAGNANELDFCVPVAATIPSRPSAGGGLGTDFDLDGGLIQVFGGNRTSGPIDVAPSLLAQPGAGWKGDFESETFVAQGFHGDVARTLTARHDSSPCADRGMDVVAFGGSTLAIRGRGDGCNLEVRNDGTANAILTPSGGRAGIGVGAVAIGFQAKQSASAQAPSFDDVTPTLDVAKAGGMSVAFTTEQTPKFNDDCALTLTKQSPTGGGQIQSVMVGMQVRRLTPTECERLQGFPDGHTRIPWRGKDADECPDGPRYKALGNSMAVPVMRWIGDRIDRHLGRVQQTTFREVTNG